METSDLYTFIAESSRHPVTGEIDPGLMLARSLVLPGNSGIQSCWSKCKLALARAKRFKEPFRSYAIDMVMSYIEGIVTIASERGFTLKEFSTTRSSIPLDDSQGQPYNSLDQFYYENLKGDKGKLKNNPRDENAGLTLT